MNAPINFIPTTSFYPAQAPMLLRQAADGVDQVIRQATVSEHYTRNKYPTCYEDTLRRLHAGRLPSGSLQTTVGLLQENRFDMEPWALISDTILAAANALGALSHSEKVPIAWVTDVYEIALHAPTLGDDFDDLDYEEDGSPRPARFVRTDFIYYPEKEYPLAGILARYIGLHIAVLTGSDFLLHDKVTVSHRPERYGFGVRAALEILSNPSGEALDHKGGFLRVRRRSDASGWNLVGSEFDWSPRGGNQ